MSRLPLIGAAIVLAAGLIFGNGAAQSPGGSTTAAQQVPVPGAPGRPATPNARPASADNAALPDTSAHGGAAAEPSGGGIRYGYAARETDPALVALGRSLYDSYGCTGCHASDTRGGPNGPSLLRAQLVQRDRAGELIGPVVRTTPPHAARPGYPAITDQQMAAIAEFLHSFAINSRDPARMRPASIVTGDPARGQTVFAASCASCHSSGGDLAAIGTRVSNPRALQQLWLAPPRGDTLTAEVTERGKSPVSGQINRMDEFLISIKPADGPVRTFARGPGTRVVITDRLAGHARLLRLLSDGDIHDVTAYLVTLK